MQLKETICFRFIFGILTAITAWALCMF